MFSETFLLSGLLVVNNNKRVLPYKDPQKKRESNLRYYHSERGKAKYRAYYKTEKYRAQRREYRKTERCKASRRKHVNRLRIRLIEILGGKCISCSYHENMLGLDVDHKNGDGYVDRKRFGDTGSYYYYLKHLDEAREKLQVLCGICHNIKTRSNYQNLNIQQMNLSYDSSYAQA